MYLKIIQTLVCYFACVIAFEDLIYVYGQESQDMQEQGRVQYQLLQERGNLPQYGSCWKDAVKHVNEGCRNLSEERQMEIALHLANCFLAMSGHDTYECELSKKPNVRGICINSMSDRAFNVYTEFYTHTQNMCWFLRGQIWHETIAENTWKVGKQLEESAKNQEEILKYQKESLELQERLIEYGNALETTMEKFYQLSKDHQEVLSIFSSSLSNMQSWLIGEISWFDTLVFYIVTSLLIIFFTSVPRTNNVRLVMLSILTLNTCIERLICYLLSRKYEDDIRDLQIKYHFYIWCSRYISMVINALILISGALFYKNVELQNNKLLGNIYNKINSVSKKIDFIESRDNYYTSKTNTSSISECSKSPSQSNVPKYFNSIKSNIEKQAYYNVNTNISNSCDILKIVNDKDKFHSPKVLQNNSKYNLRSRNGTPEINM